MPVPTWSAPSVIVCACSPKLCPTSSPQLEMYASHYFPDREKPQALEPPPSRPGSIMNHKLASRGLVMGFAGRPLRGPGSRGGRGSYGRRAPRGARNMRKIPTITNSEAPSGELSPEKDAASRVQSASLLIARGRAAAAIAAAKAAAAAAKRDGASSKSSSSISRLSPGRARCSENPATAVGTSVAARPPGSLSAASSLSASSCSTSVSGSKRPHEQEGEDEMHSQAQEEPACK